MKVEAEKVSAAKRLAAAWFALAVGALGLSALYAIVLVAARTPFLGQGASFFRTALVLHVNLSVQVWFLAMAAGVWSLAGSAAGPVRWGSWLLALGGTATMLVAPFAGQTTPILSNYIPLLDHPAFLAGLTLFAVGVVITGLASLAGSRTSGSAPWRIAAPLAALALMASIVVLSIDMGTPTDAHIGPIGMDDRLWGAGHALQLVHVLLLMGTWCVLGKDVLARFAPRRILHGLFGLTALPVIAAPVISLLHPVGSVEYRLWFTELMRWGSWPAAALLGAILCAGLIRTRKTRPLADDEKGLALSLFLFGLGCVLGATIRGESLAVPAHYHGTVGAITLAYLVWLRRVPDELGLRLDVGLLRLAQRLPSIYGFGIVALVLGLAAAGTLGIPRKAPHVDLNIDTAAYWAAMGTAGMGGFLALAAVVGYAILVLGAVLRGRLSAGTRMPRRDIRLTALAAVAIIVAGGGGVIALLPGGAPRETFSPRQHAAEKIQADIEQRFQQGVIMLHARQYEHAMTAFHRVLQLAPEAPDAYVNMGFALIGLQRYKEARDFFDSATLLRRNQVNAYYGLAIALEGMGDLPAAVGAMETYLHLTKTDDPYRRKAEAALWEWREALAQRTADGATTKR